MFNKCKIEFKKLNHINLVDDALNKIISTDCQNFYNHVQNILNKYKN